MKKIKNLAKLGDCFLIALAFYAASISMAMAQEVADCPAENALQAAGADPVMIKFCTESEFGKLYGCAFKARKSSPLPPNEKNDPGPGWLVSGSTSEGSIFIKISEDCKIVNRPFYVKTVELESAELKALESDIVVVGKVVDTQSPEPIYTHGGAQIQNEGVTVAVSEVLKGKQTPNVTFVWRVSFPNTYAKQLWLNNGHDMLFFISKGRKGNRPDMDGILTLIRDGQDAIDLATAKDTGMRYPVLSKHGNVLGTARDILNAVRMQLAAQANGSVDAREKMELSPDKYQEMYGLGIPRGNMLVIDIPANVTKP